MPAKITNGQGWVRTTVDLRQWIYSPSPLTARAPTQPGADGGNQTPDHSITNRMLYHLSYIGKLLRQSLLNINLGGGTSQKKYSNKYLEYGRAKKCTLKTAISTSSLTPPATVPPFSSLHHTRPNFPVSVPPGRAYTAGRFPR